MIVSPRARRRAQKPRVAPAIEHQDYGRCLTVHAIPYCIRKSVDQHLSENAEYNAGSFGGLGNELQSREVGRFESTAQPAHPTLIPIARRSHANSHRVMESQDVAQRACLKRRLNSSSDTVAAGSFSISRLRCSNSRFSSSLGSRAATPFARDSQMSSSNAILSPGDSSSISARLIMQRDSRVLIGDFQC